MSAEASTIHGADYEQQHVHDVYETIASHFSATRYKVCVIPPSFPDLVRSLQNAQPWPIVEAFLRSLPAGSVGLDVGCGNGKYLAVNPNIFIVGSDRSSNLVRIASQRQPHDALVADSLSLPHPDFAFDFAISIAVIHHLSTPGRRIAATRAVLQSLRPRLDSDGASGGKALIFCWALEQKDSRRGWDVGHEQDIMVPWVLKQRKQRKAEELPRDVQLDQTFQRYYHLYREGELEQDVKAAGGIVLDSGYEKDNWWAIAALPTKGLP